MILCNKFCIKQKSSDFDSDYKFFSYFSQGIYNPGSVYSLIDSVWPGLFYKRAKKNLTENLEILLFAIKLVWKGQTNFLTDPV